MYTNEDINKAVQKGIFTKDSVEEFRDFIHTNKDTALVDEENFKLIGGFNDIFVLIASSIFLFSASFMIYTENQSFGTLTFAILSWVLAEFFVLKRKMALPGIFLLIYFLLGIFFTPFIYLHENSNTNAFLVSSIISIIFSYIHYKRFKVPITVASNALFIGIFILSFFINILNPKDESITFIVFVLGLFTFIFAMYWDSIDTSRQTYHSDVSFWLHLLSAPLIIHPIFIFFNFSTSSENINAMISIIILYFIMTIISVIIDRRAFMVSSMFYVIYAISTILKQYGMVSYSMAITGVFIGASLLILSVFWNSFRKSIVIKLPTKVQNFVPNIKT